MLRRTPRFVFLAIIFFLALTTLSLFQKNKEASRKDVAIEFVENPLIKLNAQIYPEVRNYELKDWHDYEFMAYEAARVGPGENGSAVNIADPNEIEINDALRKVEGLNVFVSDKISVNRSLPDVRHKL